MTALGTVMYGDYPLTVDFTDLSTGGGGMFTYAWDFGDGGTSTSQNPSHTFVNPGTYTVTLVVTLGGFTATYTQTVKVYGRRPPRFAYDNLLLQGTVTASAEVAGFEHQNAYDGFDWTWWKAGSAGHSYLTVDCGSAKPASYLAIYAHNLGANAGTVRLQSSPDNAVWTNRSALVSPVGTECVYVTFAQVSARYWRIDLNGPATCILGVASFGVDFALEHGLYIDFASPALASDDQVQNNTSDQGNVLGRTILERSSLVTFTIEMMTDAFARATWLPFWNNLKSKPFFCLWNQDSYSSEAAWGYSEGVFTPVTYSDLPSFTKTVLTARMKLS